MQANSRLVPAPYHRRAAPLQHGPTQVTITTSMRPSNAMHHIPDPVRFPRDVRALWREDNTRGLDFADFADWELAAESFASAADIIATSEPMEPDAHDVLALVLGNLANACFRAGRIDDAIRHAQRACALRVALVGEDAIAVARARSDLAVMLCAAERTDQARALIDRAIAGVEQYAGEQDLRLVVLLENAARMAMSTGEPAHAEPYLTRMHALLSSHEVPTTRADVLLDRIGTLAPTADSPEVTGEADCATDVEQDNDHDDENDEIFDPLVPDGEAPVALTHYAGDHHAQRTLPTAGPPVTPVTTVTPVTPVTPPTTVTPVTPVTTVTPPTPVTAATPLTLHFIDDPLVAAPSFADQLARGLTAPPLAEADVFRGIAFDFTDPGAPAPVSSRPVGMPQAAPSLGFTVEYGFAGYQQQDAPFDPELVPELELKLEEELEAEPEAMTIHSATMTSSEPSMATEEFALRAEAPASDTSTAEPAVTPATAVPSHAVRERRPFASALRSGRAAAPQRSEGVVAAASSSLAVGVAAVWAFLRNGH